MLLSCAQRLCCALTIWHSWQLGVASRTIILPLVKQMRVLLMPLFHGLHRRLAAQRRLRQLVIVQGHIAQQGLLHVLAAVEPVGLEHIGYATIEPLDHAVGSRRPGLGQPMLYAQRLAQLVELMVATGLALAVGKQSVGELLAVVG